MKQKSLAGISPLLFSPNRRFVVGRRVLALLCLLPLGLAHAGPLVISTPNAVISGVSVSNSSGNCITVTAPNVTITNSAIGPCEGVGVLFDNVAGGTVTNSAINNSSTGVYALYSTGISVVGNICHNMHGPLPRGQCVQFNNVTGGGNRITDNLSVTDSGTAGTTDAFNVYESSGTCTDPIQVSRNVVSGGSSTSTGAGIVLGDTGGSYQTADHNVLTNSGAVGLAIAGGTYITATNNIITAVQAPNTNVGLYVWEQGNVPCSNITVSGNTTNWIDSLGVPNDYWNGGNCGTITGWP